MESVPIENQLNLTSAKLSFSSAKLNLDMNTTNITFNSFVFVLRKACMNINRIHITLITSACVIPNL